MTPNTQIIPNLNVKSVTCDQWREFHPDAEEAVPAKDMLPEPTDTGICIAVHKDADHAHDQVTRRSVTEVLLFLNNTPVKWISQ